MNSTFTVYIVRDGEIVKEKRPCSNPKESMENDKENCTQKG